MAPPLVMAASRAPRRARMRPCTRSQCTCAERRPRRVATPSASNSRTASKSARPSSRYGYARRTSAKSSSRPISPLAAMATHCCARTSRGPAGTASVSSSPALTARTAAAACTSSSRVSGKRMPFGTAARAWPERPTRWIRVASARGAPTWQTRSTAPTSMPSSSEPVATTSGTSPLFSRSSASRRVRRAMLPWCATTRPGAEALLQRVRDPLHQPARVDEHDGRAVAGGEAGDVVVERRPLLVRGDRPERQVGHPDREIERPAMPDVHDGRQRPRRRRPGTARPPRPAAAWPRARCAAAARPPAPRAVRARAPGARRACPGRRRGSRPRSPCPRRRGSAGSSRR